MSDTSRCVPPVSTLETVLGPLSGEGKDFAIAAPTPFAIAGRAGQALVVSCSDIVSITLAYKGAGTQPSVRVWFPAGTRRFYARADWTGGTVSPGGNNAIVSLWTESMQPNGPYRLQDGTECITP